ncbi:MAG: aminoglycoside phosphotransferase family protein [Trueperaceae bacterium]
MVTGTDLTTDSGGGLKPALAQFAQAHVGALLAARDVSWDHGESEVWALTAEGGRAVVKVHRQARKFRNERAAYTDWLPQLRPRLEPGTCVPELLAVHDEHPRALLLGLAEGEPLDARQTTPQLEAAVHERAGRFLRSLHGIDLHDADPMPLADAYELRLRAWIKRAAGIFPEAVTGAVSSALAETLPFVAGQARVACHRDFTPRNWLVPLGDQPDWSPAASAGERADGGVLTVIDFEHSQPDLYLTDLLRLWVGAWRRRPDLRSSFLKGYGRSLTSAEEEALRGLAAFWAFSTVVWASEHRDGAFERAGWKTLSWLGLV